MIAAFLLAWAAHAQSFNYGHILTATTDTLPGGKVALNNFISAVGITDDVFIATSPWLFINYNMPMVGLRWSPGSHQTGDPGVAFEVGYMKTLPIFFKMFDQENVIGRVSLRVLNASSGRLHLCFGYQYFWNDRNPYSLRPRPWRTDPSTLSASAMAEISLGKSVTADFEGGVLGINYRLPYAHLGFSIRKNWNWGHAQLGASVSWRRRITSLAATTASSLTQLAQDPNSDLWIMESDLRPDEVPLSWRSVLVHPEIQIQFLL